MRYLAGSIATLLAIFFIQTLVVGQVSREEEKFWKDKAKMYTKNPLSLKAEFENYQDQIKDLKNRNKELMKRGASSVDSDLVDSLRWALIQVEGEMQAIQSQNTKLEKAYKTQKKVGDMGIQTGLVYRVQVGAFVFHEMNNPPQKATDFVSERADGFNKYLVGNFRIYDDCINFRNELRKIGIKDAWIVPYIDGIRVTVDEAEKYLREQGSSTVINN